MARPLRIQYPGAVYHVTCRGNERQDIFRNDGDRQEFLRLLGESLDIYSVRLYSYVLMTNHFHLLLETPLGNLSKFMRHFNIRYTGYYNRRHHRAGHLYQGRYHSVLVDKDAYLTILSRYIHLNPVRTKTVRRKPGEEKWRLLERYRWSSLPGYLSRKKREPFVAYELVLSEYGGDTDAARRRYREALRAEMAAPFEMQDNVVGQSLLGRASFVDWVCEQFLDRPADSERPSVRRLNEKVGKDAVLRAMREETGKDLATLRLERGPHRRLTMELLYKTGGLTGPSIGELFGLHYSAVSQERKRLRKTMEKDRNLRALHDRLLGKMSTIKI